MTRIIIGHHFYDSRFQILISVAGQRRDQRTKTGWSHRTRTSKIEKSRTEPNRTRPNKILKFSDRFGPVGPRTCRSVDPWVNDEKTYFSWMESNSCFISVWVCSTFLRQSWTSRCIIFWIFFILEGFSVFKMSTDSRVPPRGATYHLFVDIIFQFIHFFIEIFFLFFNCVFNLWIVTSMKPLKDSNKSFGRSFGKIDSKWSVLEIGRSVNMIVRQNLAISGQLSARIPRKTLPLRPVWHFFGTKWRNC